MKRKRKYLYMVISLITILIISIFIYKFFANENKLTSSERNWINQNANNVLNVYVTNDENAFSKDGEGVYYDFLNDFSEKYGIEINIANYKDDTSKEIKLFTTNSIKENDSIFYTDHYVLVANNYELIKDNDNLKDKTIGTLNSDLDYVKSYLSIYNITFNGYDDKDTLLEALTSGEVNYIIVPRIDSIDKVLSNGKEIIYHLSDLKYYFALRCDSEDSNYNGVMTKFYKTWEENVYTNLKKEEFKVFEKSLNIADSEVAKLLSVNYNYGFINNSPYEVVMSGNYGGIIAEYLKEFSDFSGVTFNVTRYKNDAALLKGLNSNKVDLYFDYGNKIESNYNKTTYGIINSLSIVTNKENSKAFNTIYGLQNEEVYVEENSNLYNYLKSINNINIKTYKNSKELFELNKKDVIIVLDTYVFDYYNKTKLDNYTKKYDMVINDNYNFRISKNYDFLNKLLNKYMSYLDSNDVINRGLYSHEQTVKSGNILNNLAEYIIILVIVLILLWILIYRKSKKIILAKRIKKDKKIKFIDDLTCLKNRNYLKDFLETWNNNTIYPQAIIVMDLNKIKDINDKYGVSEGDKQIQVAANALIKTQLDNSELIRSDGNEFVIYTIGYTKKQIVNYIHKLNKELKKLPYDFGAEFGYSFIENNLKTVEDAMNEAILEMKDKKESDTD